jgi:hypothetical protein
MAGFTNYLEEKTLQHVFTATAYTQPARHVALFTAAPSDTGGGTEVSGGSYARVAGTFTVTAGTGGSGDPSEAANSAAVEFAEATASWGEVTHVGVFDAGTDGNLLCWAALTTPKTVGIGDVARFATGELVFTLD